MQFLREKLTEILVLIMLWLFGWDGANKSPRAWSSAIVLPTLKKKRCVYVGWFIHMFKKEEQVFTEHSLYARSMYKCRRSKIHIWVKQSPFFRGTRGAKFWTEIYFQHATSVSYFVYILHMWLCSTQHEFYSTCRMVIELQFFH